jgi:hypothetical protein
VKLVGDRREIFKFATLFQPHMQRSCNTSQGFVPSECVPLFTGAEKH